MAEDAPDRRSAPRLSAAKPAAKSAAKRVAFALAPAVLLFALLEGGLRLAGFAPLTATRDPYVGFTRTLPLFVREGGGEGGGEGRGEGAAWVTAANKRTHFNPQRFPAAKADGSLRIFCLGGSTTYGRPYADDTSFCGWLRVLLAEAHPERRFEVINAGGVSYASYRVAVLMEELLDHAPDVFVIYSGHNEFLERRTYDRLLATPEPLRGLTAALSTTRTFALAATLLDRRVPAAPASGAELLPAEVEPLLDRSVGPADYHRDDELARAVVEHYRYNVARMVAMARSAGALPLLVVPAANLRDFSPFKSEPSTDAATARRIAPSLERARDARREGLPADAEAILTRLVAEDPRRADLHYERARTLVALGRSDEAARAFERARDEDVCPLRATSSLLAAVREVARAEAAPLVDFDAWARAHAEHGIPGRDLFLDHVHPTPDAHRELALRLADALAEAGLARPRSGWPEGALVRARARVEAGLDAERHGEALRNLSKVLAWAGKFAEADALAIEAARRAPEDAGAHFQAGNAHHRAGRLEQARSHYERAVSLRPEHAPTRVALGRVLAGLGRFDAAERELRAALARRPDSAPAHNALGMVLAAQRRRGEALAHFRRAVALDSAIEPARSTLARLRERGRGRADRPATQSR